MELDRYGRYSVRGLLGRGGMGEVFLAHDPELDRLVAVKVIRAGLAERSLEARARFQREAQAMARLNHPNVVAVYDVGTAGDTIYVAMERIDGPTLAAWLAEKPRSIAQIVEVFVQAGRGLAAAHDAGLVHRDFKPSNVMLGDRVRVVDFGLARTDDSTDPLASPTGETSVLDSITSAGRLLGTPAYMAPEQREEQRWGPAADQYSFAVALREAVTGSSPRAAGPVRAVPRWLRPILERALAIDPDARHPSMDALLAAIERRRTRTRRWAIGLGAVAVIAIATFVIARKEAAAPPCDTGAEQIAPMWNDAAQQRVADAFTRTGRPYARDTFQRVNTSLDARLATWAHAHQQACEATHVHHEQSEALLDRRMRCLRRARGEIEALVSLLSTADAAVVDRAAQAAAHVGDVETCSDPASLSAYPALRDPAQTRSAEDMRQEIARIDALWKLGKPKQALADARALVPRARALAYPPVLAGALLSAARIEGDFGDKATAIEELYEVTRIGADIDDPMLVARANVLLLWVYGWVEQRFEAAEVAYRLAQGPLARAGNPPKLLGDLHEYRAAMLYQKGEFAASLSDRQRALELYIKALGPDDHMIALQLGNIADTELKLGHLTELVALHERAIAKAEKALGPDHLFVAIMLSNFGMSRLGLFDFDGAAAVLQRALDRKAKVLAADDPSIALSTHNLAIARAGQLRMSDARALIGRAIEIREAKLGLEHPLLATSYSVLANIAGVEGRYEEARQLHEKALAIKLKAYGPTHNSVAITRRAYAELLVDHDRVAEARALIEEALVIDRKAIDDDPAELRDAEVVLGKVLLAEKRFTEAHDVFRNALVRGEKLFALDHPSLVPTLIGLSDALAGSGDAAAAVSTAERAVAVAGRASADIQALAQFALARAQWSAANRTAAVTTATAARAKLASLPFTSPYLAIVDRWSVLRR